MYYQGEIEKKDRRKVITIATAIVVVVLILIVAIIVVATRKSTANNSVGGDKNTSFTIDETEDKKADEKAEETAEVVAITTVETEKPATVEAKADIPTTGPDDFVSTAVALGSLTTAATAYIMSRKNYSER